MKEKTQTEQNNISGSAYVVIMLICMAMAYGFAHAHKLSLAKEKAENIASLSGYPAGADQLSPYYNYTVVTIINESPADNLAGEHEITVVLEKQGINRLFKLPSDTFKGWEPTNGMVCRYQTGHLYDIRGAYQSILH